MAALARPRDLRDALSDLALAASALCARANTERQAMLQAAIRRANELLCARWLPDVSDPDGFVAGWIEAGGEWRALANAVNRHAGEAASREHLERLHQGSEAGVS